MDGERDEVGMRGGGAEEIRARRKANKEAAMRCVFFLACIIFICRFKSAHV